MTDSGNQGSNGEETSASRRTFMKATGAATATAAVGAGPGTASAGTDDVDIQSIINGLSLEEKVGQMTKVAEDSNFDPTAGTAGTIQGIDTVGEYFTELNLGAILSGGAKPPTFDAEKLVQQVNALQKYNIENSSHGIPFLWGVDALHGNNLVSGATILPQRINMGLARDPDLVEKAEQHTSDSVASIGAHWTYGPTVDLQRDPRWGRFFEGISESRKLLSDVSKARVRALESNSRMASTVKHFGAYSIPDNGNDRAAANTSMRDLRTLVLPPYEEALSEDPKTVMLNSGSVNGVPAHVSEWLIGRMLRDRYGFDGLITTDWDDFHRVTTNNDWAPTTDAGFRKAVKHGINAGIDMYMVGTPSEEKPGPVTFMDTLVSLVEDGEVPMERIDESVRRILELKADLGLFENPYADESQAATLVGGGQSESEELAKESMTLLKNDGDALPLSGDENVLLTGPGVHPNPDGVKHTRFLMQHGGWTLGWQGIQQGAVTADGPRPRQNLIVDVLEDRFGSSAVTHEPTGFYADAFNSDTSDPNGQFSFDNEEAVRSGAADADAVVVVLGEGPHNEGFGDRDVLELDDAQQDLVAAVTDAASDDTPVVGVVLAGSPRGSAQTFDQLDSLLFAGQPGSDTGVAVVDTLLGDNNPSGKLAFNWPQEVGHVPNHHNAYPPLDGQDPLYEIGHGLSYTDFEYSNLSVSPGSVRDPSDTSTVTVSVDVANTGDVAGEHVVEVYNTQSYGSVIHPDQRLIGFARVSLDAGESQTVEVEADLAPLEVVPGSLPAVDGKVVEAGDYELTVGDKTTTLTIENPGAVSGNGRLESVYDVNDDGRITGRDLSELVRSLRGKDKKGNGKGNAK